MCTPRIKPLASVSVQFPGFDTIARDVTVRLSVCLSVTLVHPAEAAGRNELSFGRNTRCSPNVVLDENPDHLNGKKRLWDQNSSRVEICISDCGQIVTGSEIVTIDSL